MFQLHRNWEVDLTVEFKDDQGDDALVDGEPKFSSSDAQTLAVVNPVQAGSPSAWMVTLQAIGTVGAVARWTVTADADLTKTGFEPVTASDEVQVVSGTATTVGTSYGTPRPMQTT